MKEFKGINRSSKGAEYAFCSVCAIDLKVAHVKTTTAKVLMTNFLVEDNLPFLVANHLRILVKKAFPELAITQQYSCKRTKSKHIVNEALGPHFQPSVEKLCRENKFSTMINARGVMDIGCICHLANICIVKAVKLLQLLVEDLLVDVYYHFQKSMKCKKILRSFQEFMDTEPSKILKHCRMRWLSLELCVVHVLDQWPALRSYFESHDEISTSSFSSQLGVMDSEIRRLQSSWKICANQDITKVHYTSPSSARGQQHSFRLARSPVPRGTRRCALHNGQILQAGKTNSKSRNIFQIYAMADNNSEQYGFVTQSLRELSVEEEIKLDKDKMLVSDFKQNKFEKEAQKNWDLFYKRNTTKFFKDRHWTQREFEELAQAKENAKYDSSRCLAFHCDVTEDNIGEYVLDSSVDVATMIFVLSAIHPDKMLAALKNVAKVLKPGGCLLFRDYGLYDHAMLRFSPGHKLADNFYVRQDGTRAYYFTTDKMKALAEESGLVVSSCEYVHRQTVNKKEGLCVPRVFVQGRFLMSPGGVSARDGEVQDSAISCDQETDKDSASGDAIKEMAYSRAVSDSCKLIDVSREET
ncbi:METL6-like protein [Mya arenaria]|uniref:METL6-like protein n=1 Tax=Mya arenaria TaxID=6604 RepID=A0ABY7DVH6_MYAAR|nr:METL6-like protein [Mya arenaria]